MRIKITITIVFITLFWGCNKTKEDKVILTNKEVMDLSCQDCNVIFLNMDLLRADYVNLIRPNYNNTPNNIIFFTICLFLLPLISTMPSSLYYLLP